MRAAAREHNPLYRSPAAYTRFTPPSVHGMKALKVASATIGLAVIPDRRAAACDRAFEHTARRRQNRSRSPDGALSRRPGGDARGEERLVRVDVPETGKDPLIEKERFDRRAAAAEETSEVPSIRLEGIGAEPEIPRDVERPRDINEAETAGIVVAQLRPVVEEKPAVEVLFFSGPGGPCTRDAKPATSGTAPRSKPGELRVNEPPGHPKIDDHDAEGLEAEHGVLADATDASDRAVGESPHGKAPLTVQVGPPKECANQAPILQRPLEGPHDRFHFG
jgi:hypothetical protein